MKLRNLHVADWLQVIIGIVGLIVLFAGKDNIVNYFKGYSSIIFYSLAIILIVLIVRLFLRPFFHSIAITMKYRKTIEDAQNQLLEFLDRYDKAFNDYDTTNTVFYVVRSLVNTSGIVAFQKIPYVGTERFRKLIDHHKKLFIMLPKRREYLFEISKILNEILHLCNKWCVIKSVESINYYSIHGEEFSVGEYDVYYKLYRKAWVSYLRLLEDYERFSSNINRNLPEKIFEPIIFEKPPELISLETIKDRRASLERL